MMKKLSVFLICIFLFASCAGRRRPPAVEGKAGASIAGHGFSIDAHYVSKLDSLVPKYKVLSVAIHNTSLSVIPMSSQQDRWYIVDRQGKKHRGINNLRTADRVAWRKLPRGARDLLDYPEAIPINYTVTFNLFFPKKVNLKNFEEIHFESASGGVSLKILKDS
jgi:hypothetical protein